ncbi:hypothetical protein UFOVP655_5 [uncultured Caudovirales phage]|uniref:Uncharacterized protein n=1 Tax=uncultured Caudovirales phage TaxID=2100421 RepID=A0A6J5NEA7_9CAUD|nr:hypothetical protein UFOVP655_5 [uncultured Caudovirales phage]
MADIASKLVELSADKLRDLHKRLHLLKSTSANIEAHHYTTIEMRRRGMEVGFDKWDQYEILVDTMKQANLRNLGAFPDEMISEVIKETGSSAADVQTILTSKGYEMRLEPVSKVIREYKGQFTVYSADETRSFGTYNTRIEAERRLKQIHAFKKADGFSPPSGVRAAARRAIGWIEDGKAGSGFTGVGRARASQLAGGESVSLGTINRMVSFFSRHEVDKKAKGFSQGEDGFPSAGRVSWDAWGGDAGFAWAKSIAAKNEDVKKHNQGMHDQKTHGKWADGIADAINNGEHPEVEPENVTAFLMGAAKRSDHPDLTELRVGGTLLFGDEGMGIARKDMPQVPAERRGEFLAELQAEGVSVKEEAVDPKTLKPIQKEVSSSRSGAIYNNYKEQGHIPQEQRILISSDGFVIDGHHTWGAAVGFAFDNPDAKLPVYRIGLTAKEALDRSLAWTEAQGIEGQAIDAPKPVGKGIIWKHLDGQHDQNAHGSWAGASAKPIPEIVDVAPIEGRSPVAVQAAVALRTRIMAVEPSITGMMQDLAKMSGGKLEGLANRVKSTDSLARKIEADANLGYEGDTTRAAANISDAIRYTMTMPDDQYASGFNNTVKALEASGFELRVKNFWQAGDPYDGANIKATKDGVTVEIQVHTPKSLSYKEKKLHPVYEQYRVETNDTARKSYWDKMVDIASAIPRPANYGAVLTIGTLVIQNFETAREAGLIKSTMVDNIAPKIEGEK